MRVVMDERSGDGRQRPRRQVHRRGASHARLRRDERGPGGRPQDGVRFIRVESTDLGEIVAAFKGAEAVVHMAAIPDPLTDPEHVVFRVNMLSNWNVLEAAEIHAIPRVVMASSINAIGATFSKTRVAPLYFPIDEQHPTRVEDGYAQSKWLGEEMAAAFCRRREMQIASLRFHALLDSEEQREAQQRPVTDATDQRGRAKSFWGWTDRSDAAQACRLAIERDWSGHEAFFINGTETVLAIPTTQAIDVAYPGRTAAQAAGGLRQRHRRLEGGRGAGLGARDAVGAVGVDSTAPLARRNPGASPGLPPASRRARAATPAVAPRCRA